MIYLAATLAGILVLAWVYRSWTSVSRSGRQGSDPHCVACGQNVRGVESGRCPECGATLDDGSIAIGRPTLHAGRLPRIVVGGLAGLAAVSWGGSGIIRTDWRPELVKWLPDERLATMAHGTGAWRQAATLELERRFVEEDLSADERLDLGMMLYPLNVAARRSVPIGEALAIDVHVPTTFFYSGLGGSNSSSKHRLDYRLRAVQFDDLDPEERFSSGGTSHGLVSYSSPSALAKPGSLPPGAHQVRLQWSARLLPMSADRFDPDAVALAEGEVQQVLQFEVLPEGEMDVALVADPALAAQIDNAMTAATNAAMASWQQTRVELRRDPDDAAHEARISWDIRHTRLPVPVGATVHLRDSNGNEWPAAEFSCNSTGSQCGHGYYTNARVDLRRFPGGPVDLILRSDPLVAIGEHDIYRIWAETIVIRGVPVTMPEPSSE